MKNNLYIRLIILAIMTCASSAHAGPKCVEKAGIKNIKKGEFESALYFLSACDSSKSASGDALVELARLYSMEKYALSDRKENLQKVWSLLHEAATRGSYKAVRSLVHFYQRGEPELNVSPNPALAECLAGLPERRGISEENVANCFRDW